METISTYCHLQPRPKVPTSGVRRDKLSLDVVVTRAGQVESRHRVHAAVVDASGRRIAASRDADMFTWWRSCAKPFQVLPFLEDGSFDSTGWGEEELALACASHGSEPEHVDLALRMLGSIGLDESALACGVHRPLTERGYDLMKESGKVPTPAYSNCSGKHTAMLARAVKRDWSVRGYHESNHSVQQDIWDTVSDWSGMDKSLIARSSDGCGVSVFALPLVNMAYAYAKFAKSVSDGNQHTSRVAHAMTRNSFLVGGTNAFDTLVMKAGEGRILSKLGAEGVHCVALLDRDIGIAVKVEDGSVRAQYPAVLACLQILGAFPSKLPAELASMAFKAVKNTRGEEVGAIFVPGHETVLSV